MVIIVSASLLKTANNSLSKEKARYYINFDGRLRKPKNIIPVGSYVFLPRNMVPP